MPRDKARDVQVSEATVGRYGRIMISTVIRIVVIIITIVTGTVTDLIFIIVDRVTVHR
jgi:hypothetical protein